jgi:hypothetical protein
MSIYRPGQKSGKTQKNRVWFRILKSSAYRQVDLFISLFEPSSVMGQDGTIPLVGSDLLPMDEYYQDQIETYGLGQGGTNA